ncbi:hypothetical protein [Streptomyces sp. NPDC085479]|uniref:hypothetical protein n=1 Tax=Streptomyces sp. NPDC085479 TaxID=3365726 RepID=UPI0037D24E12
MIGIIVPVLGTMATVWATTTKQSESDHSSIVVGSSSSSAGPGSASASGSAGQGDEASGNGGTPSPERIDVGGTWQGLYGCSSTPTRLKLTIVPSRGGRLSAVFAFSPHPSNPGVPRGSFRMSGEVDGGVLELRSTEWIQQPEGYAMVDLLASVEESRPSELRGRLGAAGTYDECSDFSVVRSE